MPCSQETQKLSDTFSCRKCNQCKPYSCLHASGLATPAGCRQLGLANTGPHAVLATQANARAVVRADAAQGQREFASSVTAREVSDAPAGCPSVSVRRNTHTPSLSVSLFVSVSVSASVSVSV